MQQLQCPLGYYWNGQMCLPLNVQVQSSKFVSTLELVLFDYVFTLPMLYTVLGVGGLFLLWWFRSSLAAAWKARVDPPSKPVDLSTKSCTQIGLATAAALRGGVANLVPDGSEVVDAAPNGSKLPAARGAHQQAAF